MVINAQTYIHDVFAVEALPFIQFNGPNVTFMHDNARPHSTAITRQFLATNNVLPSVPVGTFYFGCVYFLMEKIVR